MTLLEALQKQAADRQSRWEQLVALATKSKDTTGAGVEALAAEIVSRLINDGFSLDDFVREIRLKGI